MATETSMDVGILEKIGDAFNAFSEKTVGILTRLMGSSNERMVRSLGLIRSRFFLSSLPRGVRAPSSRGTGDESKSAATSGHATCWACWCALSA